MQGNPTPRRFGPWLFAFAVGAGTLTFTSDAPAERAAGHETFAPTSETRPVARPRLDLSGRTRIGIASVYARKFAGRKMADGNRMDPHDDNAASKTLPLGTAAKITNLKTGRSAEVTIQDRGPFVKGRIVDLSPSTAQQLGLTPKEGVTPVEVAPIAVPQPDGSVKPGAAAAEEAPR